ncbi:hypothetical protein C7444_11974 [Sphaerotilus hippei]|uniref:DUF3299 domain-containing protein n=1 Tax=Sphaerotilus hippei TaxID=744406 RepID=A0A318GWV9_9BURK|nr:DUF3299 domain-containing protein [Sphaerotilus hippei]PXW93563.1 hypothetical protein C7444_11974 [Sphaerotilus hippei]
MTSLLPNLSRARSSGPARRRALLVLTILGAVDPLLPAALAQDPSGARARPPRDLPWSALVPPNWDPSKQFKDRDVAGLSDTDPKMLAMMREVRTAWDNAPTRPEMDGQAVRLPGYLVPLEGAAGEWSEFLLVPYFGACIHSPPPPANQIVQVRVLKPLKGLRSMDAIRVSGVLRLQREQTDMGVSGYRIDAARVERYTEPAPR